MKSYIYKTVFCGVSAIVTALVFKYVFGVSKDTAILIYLITFWGQMNNWGK